MPILANQRHELFAQNVAKGMSLTDAAEKSDYKAPGQTGHRLMKNVEIKGRVEELANSAAEKATTALGLTKEWVIERLKANEAAAYESGQFSASVGALKLLGAESGMFTERSKTEGSVNWVVGATMSDDDKAKTSAEWADKFASSAPGKPKANGVNGANGHS